MRLSLRILSFLLLANCAGIMQATGQMDMDEDNNYNCCRTSCYECRCEPLYECSWGLQVSGGVRPIIWINRGDFLTVNCLSTAIVNDIGRLPKFSQLYRVPWQVGVQGSYAMSCNTNVYAEFNYAQARFKHHENLVRIGTSNLVLNLSKYKLWEGYIGVHYYWDRWCNRASLFVGGKAGFIRHNRIRTGVFTGVLACNETTFNSNVNDFFHRHTSFAGGANIGLDICFCGNWSFVITGEVVASCGPHGVDALSLSNAEAANLNDASALLIPGIRTEIAFPVTFGIKYNF